MYNITFNPPGANLPNLDNLDSSEFYGRMPIGQTDGP